jgi:hypothetical protein
MREATINNLVVIALVAAVAATGASALAEQQKQLEELTVPSERLPTGCSLAEATTNAVMWPGVRITANPWIGTHPVILSALRELMEPPSRVVDAPPPTPAERARFRLRLAEGVESGYAAVYSDGAARVLVYALKFVDKPRIVTRVVPVEGRCADAVAAHVAAVR